MAQVSTKEPHCEMSRPPSEYRWICAVLIVDTNVCRDPSEGCREEEREGGERCAGGRSGDGG
jgi:hypothetical protein